MSFSGPTSELATVQEEEETRVGANAPISKSKKNLACFFYSTHLFTSIIITSSNLRVYVYNSVKKFDSI